jgi:hypothetical protein
MQHRIILFLILVGFLITGTACYAPYNTSSSPASATSTPQPVEKHLSAFSPIEGTDYMIAHISGNPADSAQEIFSPMRWTDRGYSEYSGYEVYNYVFFGSETETFNTLLPTNEYVVLQIIGFPYNTPTTKPEDFEPVKWWLYILAKEDTNKNNILDYADKLTIGITDVGGNTPAEVITDADSVLGHTLANDRNTLFVIYHSLDKNYVAKIDLPDRQVVSTNEINLGTDVK